VDQPVPKNPATISVERLGQLIPYLLVEREVTSRLRAGLHEGSNWSVFLDAFDGFAIFACGAVLVMDWVKVILGQWYEVRSQWDEMHGG
jgi:hypothetical protein